MISQPDFKTRSPRVALLIETSDSAGKDVLGGVANYVRGHFSWSIRLETRALESEAPIWLQGWRGDGMIVRTQNPSIWPTLSDTGAPAIELMDTDTGYDTPSVLVDAEGVSELAFNHLMDRGFRRFGFCGLSGYRWSDRRRDSFVRRALPVDRDCVCFDLPGRREVSTWSRDPSWEEQQDKLGTWLERLPKPIGVMAANDFVGQRMLDAAGRAGLVVPEQLAVIGVDDDAPLCELATPPLSSVKASHERVGFEAAALLDRIMKGDDVGSTELLISPAGISPRRSTDATAIDDPELRSAMRFIRERACRGIAVDDVVRHAAISRSTLKRRFSATVGHTIHQEITRVRMQRAKELLSQTDLTIATIAMRVGYEHSEYFGAVFRERIGQTPGAYRKANSSTQAYRRGA